MWLMMYVTSVQPPVSRKPQCHWRQDETEPVSAADCHSRGCFEQQSFQITGILFTLWSMPLEMVCVCVCVCVFGDCVVCVCMCVCMQVCMVSPARERESVCVCVCVCVCSSHVCVCECMCMTCMCVCGHVLMCMFEFPKTVAANSFNNEQVSAVQALQADSDGCVYRYPKGCLPLWQFHAEHRAWTKAQCCCGTDWEICGADWQGCRWVHNVCPLCVRAFFF